MSLSNWWMRSQPERPKAAVPDDVRVYAIGDIHGRADLLDAMDRLIARDLLDRPVTAAVTILLGDYVDRGPDSRAVIDRLVRSDFTTPITALRGNHDDMLVGFLMGEVDLAAYADLGGDATLASYGIALPAFAVADPAERQAMLDAAIPEAHCRWLDALPLSATLGGYFFCHAGVRPGVALDRQVPADLLWIRDEFLKSRADFGRVVVHGHTPAREPRIRPNAIGIDTKAYASGTLTALVLEGTAIRFLHTN